VSTRERILETALALFNERGVHGVGVRDIARALGMSPGNLQYHFAKKDDLVAALIERMHAFNAGLVGELQGEPTFAWVAELTRRAFQNHLAHRGLMPSYAELVAGSPRLSELEAGLVEPRRARFMRSVELLIAAGLLDGALVGPRADYLFLQTQAVARFWISMALLNDVEPKGALDEWVKVNLQLWEPYATEHGRAQLAELL
jgi:AcrR family transcriptional regulator